VLDGSNANADGFKETADRCDSVSTPTESRTIIPPVADANPIVLALDTAGYRVTGPRRVVADLISGHDGHFTAADLEDVARDRRLDISRATLFRALDLLTDLGVLERVDLPSGEHAYVRCAPAHHHHVICSRCGRTTDVDDPGLADAVADIARRSGYRIESHRLELFGLCRHCQARTRADA
jgi:Fur family ferric uptake transcriptional regulator